MKPLPAHEELSASFFYDDLDGLLYWRERPDRLLNWNRLYAGRPVGALGRDGYLYTGRAPARFAVHRLIWKLVRGQDPLDFEIDHVDGDRANNRIENLRLVTTSQNRMNSAARGAWPKGVYQYKRDGSFRAQIKLGGETVYLGMFGTPEAAHAAYRREAEVRFGEFACFDR